MRRLARELLPLLLVLPSATACTSFLVGGGPSYDAGTLGVSGIETGMGGFGEVIVYTASSAMGFGFGPSLQIAGFNTDGDADPIVFTNMETRFRKPFRESPGIRAFWEYGSGLGLAWAPSIQRVVLPLHGEVGLQTRSGAWAVGLGIRERILALIGIGSPPFDAFNSLQLVLHVSVTPRR
jgi:hypothetical protein